MTGKLLLDSRFSGVELVEYESGPGLMLSHQGVPGPNHLKEWLMTDATPTPTSVYKYYDRDGILIYVGITGRGSTRNSEHNKTKPWWKFVARQSVEHHKTRERAEMREISLIRRYAPPFNKQHNRDYAAAKDAYLIGHGFGGQAGLKVLVKGRNRVPGVVVNTVGDRVTIAVIDPRVNLDEVDSLRVDTHGRKGTILDAGLFDDGSAVWVRVRTRDAEKVTGAIVMYKFLSETSWPAKVVELVYQDFGGAA